MKVLPRVNNLEYYHKSHAAYQRHAFNYIFKEIIYFVDLQTTPVPLLEPSPLKCVCMYVTDAILLFPEQREIHSGVNQSTS